MRLTALKVCPSNELMKVEGDNFTIRLSKTFTLVIALSFIFCCNTFLIVSTSGN